MYKEVTVKKITIEHSNGKCLCLKGDKAKEWQKYINGAVQMAEIHGYPLFNIKWEEIDENKGRDI